MSSYEFPPVPNMFILWGAVQLHGNASFIKVGFDYMAHDLREMAWKLSVIVLAIASSIFSSAIGVHCSSVSW